MTALTRVCCSMTSEIQMRYGSLLSRQGRLRRLRSYHDNNRRRKLLSVARGQSSTVKASSVVLFSDEVMVNRGIRVRFLASKLVIAGSGPTQVQIETALTKCNEMKQPIG